MPPNSESSTRRKKLLSGAVQNGLHPMLAPPFGAVVFGLSIDELRESIALRKVPAREGTGGGLKESDRAIILGSFDEIIERTTFAASCSSGRSPGCHGSGVTHPIPMSH